MIKMYLKNENLKIISQNDTNFKFDGKNIKSLKKIMKVLFI